MQEKSFKTIIIVAIIAIVAIVGVSAYLFLSMESEKVAQNNTTNITNEMNSTIGKDYTSNKTNQTIKTKDKDNSVKISARQAIRIVKNNVPSYNVRFGAELITSGATPTTWLQPMMIIQKVNITVKPLRRCQSKCNNWYYGWNGLN